MLDLDELEPGDRIVLRYRLPAPRSASGAPSLSDALGEMGEVTEHSVTVMTRRGPVVVPRAAITHAKRVPPAPPRRRGSRSGDPGPGSGTPM